MESKQKKTTVKVNLLVLAVLVTCVFSSSAIGAPAGYTKVWEDTFSSGSLDTANWTIGMQDPGTGDLVPGAAGRYYHNSSYANYITAEDVWVSGGNLYLQSQKRTYVGTDPAGTYDYTSGWIMSMHKVYFNKGYVEMRAQFPSGDKVWPAFWLIAEDLIWGPEWDMFEYFGYRSDYGYDVMLMNLAYGSWPNISWLGDRIDNYDTVYDCEAWHIYGFEWTADYAKFYIDDILVYQMNNTINSNWPDEEMYIVLNNGVRTNSPDTNTTWPNYVIVDYIELYEFDSAYAGFDLQFEHYIGDVNDTFNAIGDANDPNILVGYDPNDVLQPAASGSSYVQAYTDPNGVSIDQHVTQDFQPYNPIMIDNTWLIKLNAKSGSGLTGNAYFNLVDPNVLNDLPDYALAIITRIDTNSTPDPNDDIPLLNYNLDMIYPTNILWPVDNVEGNHTNMELKVIDECLRASQLAGDPNFVNFEDLAVQANSLGKIGPHPGDLNADNKTDMNDLAMIVDHWLCDCYDL